MTESAASAVVTGASSRIGAATARLLARRGFSVAISARRAGRLEDVARECRREGSGIRVISVPGDMTRKGDVERLRDAALASFSEVSAWINNAGRGVAALVEETTEEQLDSMIAVNLKTALFGIQAILPHFKERGRGAIVNVGSILGRVPYVFRGGYCAAKHALIGLAGCLRQELVAEGYGGISVSTVIPGPVGTEFSGALEGDRADASSRAMAAVRERFASDPAYAGWLDPQSPEVVAGLVIEAISHPRPEIYTSPGLFEHALAYANDPDRREEIMAPVAKAIFQAMPSRGPRSR